MSLRALPSWLVATCAVLVVGALVGFAVTSTPDTETATPTPSISPTPAAPHHRSAPAPRHPQPRHARPRHAQPSPPVERRTAYVEVYNNSGITGLAADTGAVLQDSGWRVVTTDNWYGEIPANTVYYPSRLQAQARLLARDLGVARVHPAVAPMSFDRLTVILTSPV